MDNPLDSELAALDHDVKAFLPWALLALAAFVLAVWLAAALIFSAGAPTWLWLAGVAGVAVWVWILAKIAWVEFFRK